VFRAACASRQLADLKAAADCIRVRGPRLKGWTAAETGRLMVHGGSTWLVVHSQQENEKVEQARQRELEAALRQLEEEKRRALLLNPGFAVIGLRQVRRRVPVQARAVAPASCSCGLAEHALGASF